MYNYPKDTQFCVYLVHYTQQSNAAIVVSSVYALLLRYSFFELVPKSLCHLEGIGNKFKAIGETLVLTPENLHGTNTLENQQGEAVYSGRVQLK